MVSKNSYLSISGIYFIVLLFSVLLGAFCIVHTSQCLLCMEVVLASVALLAIVGDMENDHGYGIISDLNFIGLSWN